MLSDRRSLLALLIVVATGLFVVGVTIERGQEAGHTGPASVDVASHEESETNEQHETTEVTEAVGEAAEHDESGERVLGVDAESWPVVAAVALAGLLLAAAIWTRRAPPWLLIVGAIALAAFAVADLREVGHQLDENNAGLAVLAAAVAVLHGAAAALAAWPDRSVAASLTPPGRA